MSNKVVDLYVLYRIIKDIGTPFEETEAYELGLIDDKGKRLKKASTKEEKDAMSYYNRFIFNIKRALSRVGLDRQIATYAGALFLLREMHTGLIPDEKDIIKGIDEEMQYLNESTYKSYKDLYIEDAPAMATGAAVAGTGDDPVHWKYKGRPRVKGRAIDATAFIKRMNKQRTANNVVSKVR